MIKGVVNDAYEAVVRLTVQGPSGQSQEIEAVIDTGYNGFLTLPPALVTELGLVYRDRSRATLALTREHWLDVHGVVLYVFPMRWRNLRALLQQADMFERHGWSRSRARDCYDLWRVFGIYKDRMDLAGFDSVLREKCAIRGVSFTGPGDFFHEAMLAYVEETWEQWLGPLVPGLPSFDTVITGLRPQVAALVPTGTED